MSRGHWKFKRLELFMNVETVEVRRTNAHLTLCSAFVIGELLQGHSPIL